MKRYEGYKLSGLDWLEQIPDHWDLMPLFTKFRERNEKNTTEEVSEVLSLSYGKIIPRDVSTNFGLLPESFRTYQIVYPDDIIIRPTDLQNDDRSLRVGRSQQKGIITSAYICLEPREIDASFAHYLLHAFDLLKIYYKIGAGVRQTLKFEDLKRLPVLIPPLDEQQSIASFLDQKTKQIDKLIVNKKKLIGLLKEERTAIVNQAVTKGIDPNAKLKPSGIEWLGDIPEHWETKKIRYLVSKVGSGITPNGGANVYQETGIPLLRSQNIYSDGLILDDVAYISETIDEEMRNSHIEEGDVLLNITGGSIGRCFYVPRGFGRGNVNQHVCIIRPIKSLVATEYLHAVLVSGYGQNLIDMSQVGANREGLNFPQIKGFQIPYCDLSEQKLIVEFIAKKSSAFGATISKIEKEIEFLSEYRTALISEVVTGKVRVAKASNVVAFPEKKTTTSANVFFKRAVLATEIVHQLHTDETFGHVKFMKVMYLAEHHAELDETESNYYRQAAGPMDNKLLSSVEKQMTANKWYLVTGKKGERKRYVPQEKAGKHTEYFNRYWSEKKPQIQEAIDICKNLDTQRCEIVATIYAVWNDFIIDGKTVTDDEIVDEILTNWSAQKSTISKERWLNAIGWMRTKNFVPKGFGKKTQLIPSKRGKK